MVVFFVGRNVNSGNKCDADYTTVSIAANGIGVWNPGFDVKMDDVEGREGEGEGVFTQFFFPLGHTCLSHHGNNH